VTTFKISDLAIYRMNKDRATAVVIDPVMFMIGCVAGIAFACYVGYQANAEWALVADVGAFVLSLTTTHVHIDARGVTIKQHRMLLLRETRQHYRGAFEADYTTAFEDDSEDGQAIKFRGVDENGRSDTSDEWRALHRQNTIAQLNGQLERFGLLDRGQPQRSTS
jgi:hypothetical protein